MLVNYYYVCIRLHDSKPWRGANGSQVRKFFVKKHVFEQVNQVPVS
jgi:hypothetical protein